MADDLTDVSHLLTEHGYLTADNAAAMLNITPAGFRSYVARESTGAPKPVAQVTKRVPLWSVAEITAWQETRQGRGVRRKAADS